ncbi:MSMEG_0570 family nitrogen starvation response protein [Fertoebacter nigrum]|uniref:MSMEG_0570 family nitrogen starvation response protein n=1 Tax=Fertoeibacter niger TaxID=2656921 RepID=A0A8X8H8J6_9RHOB|nr:MSMEG_0570 family nitrogen starvation response protein [Fertoeibacter niger]NUB45511.1 MSMEG_0570 family nitrogen starvation response protein [Fertoeibacter niger]
MPEVIFHIRWPDGHEERCYSPSTVIHQHLVAGHSYPLAEFVARARAGLNAASDRVAATHGHPCSRAMGQLARIEAIAARMTTQDATVFCLSLT